MAENVKPESDPQGKPLPTRRRGKGITSDAYKMLPPEGLEGDLDLSNLVPGKKVTTTVKPRPLGVLLTLDEQYRLSEIAQDLGVTRHSLLVYIVREFIDKYDTGSEKPETKTTVKTTLVSNRSKHS